VKLKLILASCVLALAACATTGTNATDANIVQGLNAALGVAQTLYAAGKLTDAEAQATEDALNAIFGYVKASRTAAAAGDTVTSAAYLREASAALDALAARLAAKQVAKPGA
jgi:hypothetical protein